MSPDQLIGLYRIDFRAFINFAFRELYPAKAFIDAWYLDIVADELMQCGPDGNHRLMLNLPPRYLKSFCTSIAWPLFMAARNGGMKISVIAGTRELAAEFTEMRKRLLESPRMLQVFPQLRFRESGEALTFYNESQIIQSQVARSQIGRSADIFIIDDPLPARHARNEKKRGAINDWYDDEMIARLSRKDRSTLVLVMQRLHRDDLCGHLLRTDGHWKQIALSAIAKKDELWRLGNGRIIERAAGDVLCDRIETRDALLEILMEMKGINFRAQYLQCPALHPYDREQRTYFHHQRVTEDWKPSEPKLLQNGGFFIIPAERDVMWEYFDAPNPFLKGRKVSEEEFLIEFKTHQLKLLKSHGR